MNFEAADDDRELHLSQKWVVNLKGCKTWVPKQKEVNDGTFLALSKWDRQCILAFTDRALDLTANKDGGSLNSEVWAELLQARQDVADKAIEEAHKTEDQDEARKKKHKVRASSKHDFMAPPILTVQYKDYSFRVLYEGLGGTTLWVEAKEETLRMLKKFISESKPKPVRSKPMKAMPKKSPKKRRQLSRADSK